jgi:hypothetical protein
MKICLIRLLFYGDHSFERKILALTLYEKFNFQSDGSKKQRTADADDHEINVYHLNLLMCISCGVLIALFVKAVLLKWFWGGTNSANKNVNRHQQSIECNQLVESSPLFSRDSNTCEWCNIVERSCPIAIPKLQNDSPQGSYHSTSAEYDLITWRMYHRITSSRRVVGHHPVKDFHIICEPCRDDVSEAEKRPTANEPKVTIANEVEIKDEPMLAFSFEP